MLFLSLLLLLTLHFSNPLSTKLAPRAISTPRSLAIQHLSRTNCTTTTPPPPPHFSALDTSFLHLLTTTVHRNTPRLLLTLSSFYTRPPKKARAPVTAALLLGAAQLLILKTPPHAAVGETIAALKQVRPPVNQQTINFVNAVLRRVSKEGEAVFGTLEATVNVGDYLKEKVIADWGEGVGGAVLAEMTADRTVGISITCKDSKVTSAAFDGLTPAIPNQITTSGAVILRQVGVGSIPSLPGYSDGSWWVQGEATREGARGGAKAGIQTRETFVVRIRPPPLPSSNTSCSRSRRRARRESVRDERAASSTLGWHGASGR